MPKQLASKCNVDQKVLSKTPSHAVKVLGREHGPDEKMCSKRRASRHDKRDADGNEEGLKGDVLHKGITTALVVLAEQQEVRGRGPKQGAGPVAHKGEDADGDDVEAADAIVGARQIDRRDGVGAAKGEEGGVLEEDGCRGDLGDRHVDGLEGVEEDVGEEE